MLCCHLSCRYPWGEEAFAKARSENKPIFLSVGYSTCHWCHVMERESFENEEIGKILNENFVSIKVDREERPDVDRVYMTFIQVSNMTRSGKKRYPSLNFGLAHLCLRFCCKSYITPHTWINSFKMGVIVFSP